MAAEANAIVAAVKSALDRFPNDELAYLILTGDVEATFRDAVALWLRNNGGLDWKETIREWPVKKSSTKDRKKREQCDIAVVENGEVTKIIELKHLHDYDNLHRPEMLLEELGARKCNHPDALIFGILLVTNQSLAVPKEYGLSDMKYQRRVLASLKKRSSEEALAMCKKKVDDRLERAPKCRTSYEEIVAGDCFGVRIREAFWVLGPV